MALSEEDLKGCLHEPDLSTKDFIMQQTMLRVKDPKVSLDFYTRIIGMRLVFKIRGIGMCFVILQLENFLELSATRLQVCEKKSRNNIYIFLL